MSLAAKSYAEGGLALALYATRLLDDQQTAPDEPTRRDSGLLLDVLTPIVKSWPSQWCLVGTVGIQALDLLGRKVRRQGGAGLDLLFARMAATADAAPSTWDDEATHLRKPPGACATWVPSSTCSAVATPCCCGWTTTASDARCVMADQNARQDR